VTTLQRPGILSATNTPRRLLAALALGALAVACNGRDPDTDTDTDTDTDDLCAPVDCGANATCVPATGECACDAGYTDLDGDCVNSREVPCEDVAPANATSTVVDVQVAWDGSAWGAPAPCAWECDAGFGEWAGECLSARTVACDDTPPANARSVDPTVQVEILWDDATGWATPEQCAWECLQDFGLVDGACVDTQTVICLDDPPEGATTTDATFEVEITYDAETGWSAPDRCPWECATGFHPFDGSCRANVDFSTCYIQWPPVVEEWIGREVTFYGRVATTAAAEGGVIPGLESKVCFGQAPLAPGFDLDDLTCHDAALNTEAGSADPEYMASVAFEVEAELDYVYAFSGDGGGTWQACDLRGIVGHSSVDPGAVSVWGIPRNGGFEHWADTGLPVSWTKAVDTGVERDADVVRDGDYSVKLTRRSTNNANNEFSATLAPVDGSTEYLFEMWVFDNNPNARINIVFQWYDASGTSLAAASFGSIYTEDGDEWQKLTRTATSPEAARFVRVATRVYSQSGGAATGGFVYMDGVFVSPVVDDDGESGE
jgi:hypothetical protein